MVDRPNYLQAHDAIAVAMKFLPNDEGLQLLEQIRKAEGAMEGYDADEGYTISVETEDEIKDAIDEVEYAAEGIVARLRDQLYALICDQ